MDVAGDHRPPRTMDDMDIDLLRMRCNELEAERDAAWAQRDAAWEDLGKVQRERDEAREERDQAVFDRKTLEKAAQSASSLIRLAAGVQK